MRPAAGEAADSFWSLVDVTIDVDRGELVSERLWQWGVQGIEECEAHSDASHRVRLRTNLGPEAENLVQLLHDEFPGIEVERALVPRTVADTWRDHVRATWVDDRHVIVPAWQSVPHAEVAVRIEPGDQFGLGNHDTTVLAARLMLDVLVEGSRWLDLGCGSGVLAIVGARSRRAGFLATDIAPGARAMTEQNIRTNGCADLVEWVDSVEGIPSSTLDGVVANILAPVLREVAGEIRRVVRVGGTVVLSGMLADQVGAVLESYEPFSILSRSSEGPWAATVIRLE